MNDCENLFDIKCADLKRIKEQENIQKVKQKTEDIEFHKKQCLVPQVTIITTWIFYDKLEPISNHQWNATFTTNKGCFY